MERDGGKKGGGRKQERKGRKGGEQKKSRKMERGGGGLEIKFKTLFMIITLPSSVMDDKNI